MKIHVTYGIKSLSNNENYDVNEVPYLGESSQNPIGRFRDPNEQNNISTMA